MNTDAGSGAAAPVAPQAPWVKDAYIIGRWTWGNDYVIFQHGPDEDPEGFYVHAAAHKMPKQPEGAWPDSWPRLHRADTLVEAMVVAERNEVALIHARRHEIAVEDETLRRKLSMLKNRTVA